jgi:hypothetical protein
MIQPKKANKRRVRKATYVVPAGVYESPTLVGLCWEVLKHRTWHLVKHRRWTD